MSARPATENELLHLFDLDSEIDPLAALVIDGHSTVLARHLEHPVLSWRTSAQLVARPPQFIVAWGQRAFDVARSSGARNGIYRPDPSARPLRAIPGWRAAASTQCELARLEQAGWSARDCFVAPPPGIDAQRRSNARPVTSRAELGIGADDFIWLLSGDATKTAGLRQAIWAGTLMHVMERARRPHRILLWGDRPAHRRARSFIDQLGLPGLHVTTARYPYDTLTDVADAALLLPQGPSGVWSAAVVALAGLPAVINQKAQVQEVLGGRANVRTAPGEQARLVVREMLRLTEVNPARTQPDRRYAPDGVLELWRHHLNQAQVLASERQMSPDLR